MGFYSRKYSGEESLLFRPLQAYTTFIPKEQHTQGKEHTPFIERSNNVLRQRIGRLVRKTCSFSRCLVNLENQIKFFIFYYNKKYNFVL